MSVEHRPVWLQRPILLKNIRQLDVLLNQLSCPTRHFTLLVACFAMKILLAHIFGFLFVRTIVRHVTYANHLAVITYHHLFHEANPGVSWLCAPEYQQMFRTLSPKSLPLIINRSIV